MDGNGNDVNYTPIQQVSQTMPTNQVNNGSTSQGVQDNKGKISDIALILIPFLLVCLIGIGIGGALLSQKITPKTTTDTTATINPKSFPTIQPTTSVLENDPMKIFFSTLSAADYKIATTGKLTNAKQAGGGTESSSIDLNNGIIYVQKGSVVRVDKTDPAKPETGFIMGDKVYALQPTKKTYVISSITDSIGQFYASGIRSSLPLISLADDSKKGLVTWQKSGDNEWQADWKWKTPLDATATQVKVKIRLDSKTSLITNFSVQFDVTQPWQEATFQYEIIPNIESLLAVPPDYQEQKL